MTATGAQAIIQLARRISATYGKVLILCPTGQLVTSYRQRIEEDEADSVVVETLHSGFRIVRDADAKTYAPPSRLRRYDAIILDEASQVDDRVSQLFYIGYTELPQKPVLVLSADYQQLRQVGHSDGKSCLERLSDIGRPFHLLCNYRTQDEDLKAFLKWIRTNQPDKDAVREFFQDRLLDGDLGRAVLWALQEGLRRGYRFTWLCVTHKGVRRVNEAALRAMGITAEMLEQGGYPGDPKVGAGKVLLRPGLRVRLSRNLDKPRGFVNGALGTIRNVLAHNVAVVELESGKLVLLHPVTDGDATFLPCAYGYATTIRKAQGASLDGVILYFDHGYPPDRGYGYVGASRARTRAGLYHYGRLRRTDWLPVNGDEAAEQVVRGYESESSGGEEEEDEEDDDEGRWNFAEDGGEEQEDQEDDYDEDRWGFAEDDDEQDLVDQDADYAFGALAREAEGSGVRDDAGLL